MLGVMLTEITEQNFDEEVLNSDLPVFACFITSWCRSCYPTCLVVDELAKKYEREIKFVKIDADKSPEISARYHVIALPTIILFQDSQPVDMLRGFQRKTSLKCLLDSLIAERQTHTIRLVTESASIP